MRHFAQRAIDAISIFPESKARAAMAEAFGNVGGFFAEKKLAEALAVEKDIEVKLANGRLTIKGEKKEETEETETVSVMFSGT